MMNMDYYQLSAEALGGGAKIPLLKLGDSGDYTPYCQALASLYGESTLAQAEALLTRQQRFFGIAAPGKKLSGFALHQRLLDAYDKVRRQHR